MAENSKYMHIYNGGLTFGIAQADEKSPPVLFAQMTSFGNLGPKIEFPLLTIEQCEEIIKMASEAKKRIMKYTEFNHGNDFTHNMSKPE